MTEKRFILFEDLDIKDKSTGKIYPPCLDRGLKELVDLLNTLNDENTELLQFKYKVYRIINARINVLENDYNQAVKAGMPSNSVYGEIELLEELLEELGK